MRCFLDNVEETKVTNVGVFDTVTKTRSDGKLECNTSYIGDTHVLNSLLYFRKKGWLSLYFDGFGAGELLTELLCVTHHWVVCLFNPMYSLVPDEFYFDIKLIHNNKIKNTCIICGHNEVAGYNVVTVYNSNYVPAQNGNFYGYGNIYYTKTGNYCYCEKHYPFPNVLDD